MTAKRQRTKLESHAKSALAVQVKNACVRSYYLSCSIDMAMSGCTSAYKAFQDLDSVLDEFGIKEIGELFPDADPIKIPTKTQLDRAIHLSNGIVDAITASTDFRHELKREFIQRAALILKHHPHYRPNKVKKSPSPIFHAVRRSAYKDLRAAYNWFETAYREAADRLRSGDLDVDFPEGSFPPHLPFVHPVLSLAPG